MSDTPATIDAYLERVRPDQRAALDALRQMIARAAPEAEECISYQQPAFRQGRLVVGFGATRKHCALYLMSGTVLGPFAEALTEFDTSKGTIRFQPDHPLPEVLVRRLVEARLAENAAKRR